MNGNGPADLALNPPPPQSWCIARHAFAGTSLVDGYFVAVLIGIAAIQTIAYWRAGLSYSPDSGFYLLYAARLHDARDYAAGAAMYAPLFPAAIAVAMVAAPYPGQAATLVLGISACIALVGTYSAARVCRAPTIVALAFALLLLTLPSTTHVFGYAWTEGMMLAVLIFTSACYATWIRTRADSYGWLTLLASTAAPLIKYVAIFVPVLTTLLVLLHALRQQPCQGRWRMLGMCPVMFVPTIAHGYYNYHRWGTVTGHGPAKVTLDRNIADLYSTVTNTLGVGGLALLVVSIVAGLIVLLRTRKPLLVTLRSPLIATVAYGTGYFACLVLAASAAQVDPLDQRLAAPGFGLALLAAAQATGVLYSMPGLTRRLQLTVGCVAFAACAIAGRDAARSTYTLLHDKLVMRAELVAAYDSGFGTSASRDALSQFYREGLNAQGCMSVTMLNAEPPLGRIRREWYAIAEALAAPPFVSGEDGNLAQVTRERIAIGVDASGAQPRLIFVPARIPELQRIHPQNRVQGTAALNARIGEVMTRIVEQARRNGCSRHWVLVPSAARWFHVESEQRFAAGMISELRSVGTYQAIGMRFVE
jgi:hypothetical protein